MPMLMITGQKAIKTARQARFQIVDIVGAMRPLTKMTRQIVSPAAIPTMLRDAFRVAVEERPGPVHLELPEDIAAEEAEVALVPPHPIDRPIPSPSALDRTAAMILAAKRPLIMIGAAGNRPRLVEPLSAFVRRTGIPFFNTQMGKGAVTGVSDLYLGTAALSERDYIHEAIDKADLIIAIGHDTVEKPPFLMGDVAGGPKVIYIGYISATVEQVFHPDAELIGDIGAAVTALAVRLEGRLHPDPTMFALQKRIRGHIKERAESDRFPMIPQRLVHDVRAAMPEDGIVCLDNGMYKIWFARNYRTHVANTLLLDNALATMGAGLPSAIAAKLLNPQRRVMAVCGDGGFMMNSQELETAVRLGLDLVVLIVEDCGLWHDPVEAGGRSLPRFRHDLRQSRFRDLCSFLWCPGSPDCQCRGARSDPGGGLRRRGRSSRGRADRLQREHPCVRGRARRPCARMSSPADATLRPAQRPPDSPFQPPGNDRQQQLRGMRGVVVDGLPRNDGRSRFAAAVVVALEFGEIGGGDVEAQAMAGGETIGGGPHIDLEAIDLARLQQLGLALGIAVARPDHAALQLDGAPVGKHVAEPAIEIGVRALELAWSTSRIGPTTSRSFCSGGVV